MCPHRHLDAVVEQRRQSEGYPHEDVLRHHHPETILGDLRVGRVHEPKQHGRHDERPPPTARPRGHTLRQIATKEELLRGGLDRDHRHRHQHQRDEPRGIKAELEIARIRNVAHSHRDHVDDAPYGKATEEMTPAHPLRPVDHHPPRAPLQLLDQVSARHQQDHEGEKHHEKHQVRVNPFGQKREAATGEHLRHVLQPPRPQDVPHKDGHIGDGAEGVRNEETQKKDQQIPIPLVSLRSHAF